MKNILFVLFVLFSLSSFSQVDAKAKTVLNKFILGYDSEKSIKEKGVDISKSTQFEKTIIVRLNEYDFGKDVILVFVDNTLYSVRYNIYTSRQYDKYLKKLYENYNVLSKFGDNDSWFNKYIQIEYNLGADDGPESFVHYDIVLLKKYPQYKDF